MSGFPDREPGRAFSADRCFRVALRGAGRRIEIPREVGLRKPLFRQGSFWDTLMGVAAASEARYVDYSYRERADCYSAALTLAGLDRLRASAGLVKYSALQQQIRGTHLETMDLLVTRA